MDSKAVYASSPTPAGCYAVAAVLMAAVAITVVLRVHVRRMKKIQLGLDDLFIFIAALITWAMALVIIVGTARGTIGTHTLQNPVTGAVIVTWHESDIAKLGYISQVLSIVAFGALKLSVLLVLRRIFVGKTFDIVSKAALGLVSAWTIAFFFANVFECGANPAYYWTSPKTLIKYCSGYKSIMLGHAVVDVITDIFILTIPLPIIWKLHMTMGQKVGLLFVFVLGYISTASALARMVFLITNLVETTTGARDVRGDQTNYMIWAYVEAGIGIVGASLPTLRPLLNARMPESLVNSVRSALSLGSNNNSPKASKPDPATHTTDSDAVELDERSPHGSTSAGTTAHASASRAGGASPPAEGIVKEDRFGIEDSAV